MLGLGSHITRDHFTLQNVLLVFHPLVIRLPFILILALLVQFIQVRVRLLRFLDFHGSLEWRSVSKHPSDSELLVLSLLLLFLAFVLIDERGWHKAVVWLLVFFTFLAAQLESELYASYRSFAGTILLLGAHSEFLFVELHLQFLHHFHFWSEIAARHALKERLDPIHVVLITRLLNHAGLEPLRNATLVAMPKPPIVNKDDCSIVLNMPDYSANCLIHGSCGLLIVPGLAVDASLTRHESLVSKLLVQVVLLKHNFRLCHLRVRNADDKNTTSCVVTKVEALRDPASADSHQNGASDFLVIDVGVVHLNGLLVQLRILWLTENGLDLVYSIVQPIVAPLIDGLLHDPVRWEEDQDAAGSSLGNVDHG